MNRTWSGDSERAKRRLSNLLPAIGTTALGLATSPAALAFDRGGPGSPAAQQFSTSAFFPVSKLPQRYLS